MIDLIHDNAINHWKCSGIRADSGAKILVLMEIGQKNQIDKGLGSPNSV